MASSTTFNALQHEIRIFSTPLCKFPFSLHPFHFHSSLQPPCPNHTQLHKTPSRRARFSASVTSKLSKKDPKTPGKAVVLERSQEPGSGSGSLSSDDGVDKSNSSSLLSSILEAGEKAEKMSFNGRNVTKRRKLGFSRRVNNLVDKEVYERNKGGSGATGEKKMRKLGKKGKANCPEVALRAQLDMCSKKGDVMGAIQLYENALREGTKMGQYHYAVLLYLCSSAAVGFIQPAKSGSGSRNSNMLSAPVEGSSLNANAMVDSLNKADNGNGSGKFMTSLPSDKKLTDTAVCDGSIDESELSCAERFDNLDEGKLWQSSNGLLKPDGLLSPDCIDHREMDGRDNTGCSDESSNKQGNVEIRVTEDVKNYALQKGFEIYEKMCLDEIPMNEAALTAVARMAMSMGNGDMAFDMVNQMAKLGISPRLRSYEPALSAFCNKGDIEKAFAVENHMLDHGVYPEEPELEALLRVSIGAGKGDKVYYLLHRLRTTVRKVSPSASDVIVSWFESKASSRFGKRKVDQRLIKEAIKSGGGGWHGKGWLGKGRWTVSRTTVGADALCRCCGEKLALIDLDPLETERFAESVASIAIQREKNSSFQKFQKWLEYHGPFETVIDGANVGLFRERRFKPTRINAVVSEVRQRLPSRKWPLIVLHNKRINGNKLGKPVSRELIDKWRNADALYATPTGSNDDWYWLYAAIKFKCLLVTNDEMRDHTFQLLGNEIFPRWKERHQVHFSFPGIGPVFHMPPPCSVVIQESEKGCWHIPVASEDDYNSEITWLCIRRACSDIRGQDSATIPEGVQSSSETSTTPMVTQAEASAKSPDNNDGNHEKLKRPTEEIYENIRDIVSASMSSGYQTTTLSKIEAAEMNGCCVIDFQI